VLVQLKGEVKGCGDVVRLLEAADLAVQLVGVGATSDAALQTVLLLLLNRFPKVGVGGRRETMGRSRWGKRGGRLRSLPAIVTCLARNAQSPLDTPAVGVCKQTSCFDQFGASHPFSLHCPPLLTSASCYVLSSAPAPCRCVATQQSSCTSCSWPARRSWRRSRRRAPVNRAMTLLPLHHQQQHQPQPQQGW
jgi:hypothetical protein